MTKKGRCYEINGALSEIIKRFSILYQCAFSSPETTSVPSSSISFNHLGCCFLSQALVTQPLNMAGAEPGEPMVPRFRDRILKHIPFTDGHRLETLILHGDIKMGEADCGS
jgi:hypothetical protein